MKNLKLDSVLLFVLVIPFIMSYRLSPGDTPYWLFGLIFLNLLSYLTLDIISLKTKTYNYLKQIILWFTIVVVLGSAFISAIIVRHQTHPIYMVHDIVIQQELAIRFLLHGKNPYVTTYFGTPLEQWHYSDKEVNPALYHFVMQPFYLLFALPFYFFSNLLFGFFDGRIPLLLLFFSLLAAASFLVKEQDKKRLFVVLLAFNPAMLGYTLEGRSDIFMYAFLFFAFYLLNKKRYLIAGIPMALSFAVKQSAWPILPLYIAYLYFKNKNFRATIKNLSLFIVTFLAIVAPFFFWDSKAFLNSTVFYLSGGIDHGYPISGYGLGSLLGELGVIKDFQAYYPFYIWQFIASIILLPILLLWLRKKPNVARLLMSYGIFLFVFWYFSRYFNNSHLAYLSVIFISAYFWPEEE